MSWWLSVKLQWGDASVRVDVRGTRVDTKEWFIYLFILLTLANWVNRIGLTLPDTC